MKKALKIIGILFVSLLFLLLLLAGGVWLLFGEILTAAASIRKEEEGLYSMEYRGDYGFDEFLEQGGAESDAEMANYLISFLSKGFYSVETQVVEDAFGCSTLAVKNEAGEVLFGRNYDWAECRGMIVHTVPKNGYESLSTCCLDFLGFGDYAPDGSMMERIQSLAAIYVPLDGMNEMGLMVADLMAGDKEVTNQQTERADLTTTSAIRLLLDKAATTKEAIELLQKYDMHSSIGAAHHLSICDKSGDSAVVEYVNGKMLVTRTKVVTNHYLTESEKKGVGSEQSHLRYDMLLQQPQVLSADGLKDAMKSVAQFNFPQEDYERTMWTVLYSPTDLTARFFFAENYESNYAIALKAGKWLSEKE